jgi:hypothetical protein
MACERANCAAQLREAATVKANAKRQLGGTITESPQQRAPRGF